MQRGLERRAFSAQRGLERRAFSVQRDGAGCRWPDLWLAPPCVCGGGTCGRSVEECTCPSIPPQHPTLALCQHYPGKLARRFPPDGCGCGSGGGARGAVGGPGGGMGHPRAGPHQPPHHGPGPAPRQPSRSGHTAPRQPSRSGHTAPPTMRSCACRGCIRKSKMRQLHPRWRRFSNKTWTTRPGGLGLNQRSLSLSLSLSLSPKPDQAVSHHGPGGLARAARAGAWSSCVLNVTD